MMKAWFALLVACASEPKPEPVFEAPPETADGRRRVEAEADRGQEVSDLHDGEKSAAVWTSLGDVDDPTMPGPSLGGVPGIVVNPQRPGQISLFEKKAFDRTTLTAEVVAAKITGGYMLGVRRCYRNYLKTDPNATGELVLKLTVNRVGRVVDATVKGVAAELDDCTTAQMASWRFPIPRNHNGVSVTAAFQIKLDVIPN